MKSLTLFGVAVVLISLAACSPAPAPAARSNADAGGAATTPRPVDDDNVDDIIKAWGPRQVVAARQMMAAYGAPQEATAEKLVWHRKGPYKRITVSRVEDPHDFPKPHMDFLQHTIDYRIPSDKATALYAYDGSVTLDRTVGEMSARCDIEGHNILTLNLAHDIVTGKKDAKQARMAFGEIVNQDMKGEKPAYVTALQFDPAASAGADPDVPTIPGAPVRAKKADGTMMTATGDAEVLGLIGAVNENEILAAVEAQHKKVSGPVMDYARMLHQQHGQNLEMTVMLGQKINTAPVETAAVDAERLKGATKLAELTALTGEDFERKYLEAMVAGHTEVLQMIDTKLMGMAQHDAVKKHLTETRAAVAGHLEKARGLESKR